MRLSEHCKVVNKTLLPVKIHYFLFMAALACALPFRTVFAKQLGISATAVGVIFCVVPFIKTVTNPLFGFVLDYFKRFRLTISVITVFVALSHVAMVFIPPNTTLSQKSIHFSDQHFISKITYFCSNETLSSSCDDILMMYSEYTERNKFKREKRSFTCDLVCSDATNVTSAQDLVHYNKKISWDFKVLVNISDCDMGVRLLNGKVHVPQQNIRNSISTNINESSITQLDSWGIPSGKCVNATPTHSDSFMRENNETMTINKQSMLFEEISLIRNLKRYISKSEQKQFDENNERYRTLNRIKASVGSIIMDKPCISKLTCQTKNCNSDVQLDNFLSEVPADHGNEYLSAQFWTLFFLIALSSILLSAVIFLMDAVCYEMLQENRDKYGQQRLWGTIGWGVGALVGGYLNQIITSDASEVNYAPGFYLLAVLALMDIIPIYTLKVTEIKYSAHIWKDVCFLFSKINIVYNVIVVYLVGVLSGFIWNYQFWFMEEIGSSQVLLGLSQTFEGIFELPWFLVSGTIIKKIGHDHCNSITFLCFGLRYLSFVVMHDPWWTLAAGVFHGPTFGLFYASMTMYAKNEAPPGTEATVQSLLHLFFEGIGVATGSFLGGMGLDNFGSRMSFAYAAALSFLMLFFNVFITILISRSKKNSKDTPSPVSCP